jgi:putative nucleotidyltransferase with HDIG domain
MLESERRGRIGALFPDLGRIASPQIRDGVVRAFLMAWEQGGWRTLEECPLLAKAIRDPNTGVEHFQAVVALSVAMADIIERFHRVTIHRDHLIAGAILHDVGKLLEHAPAQAGRATGPLLRHPASGAHLALTCGLPIEVAHIIATHSAEGSVTERTLEAAIVAVADRLDADVLFRRDLGRSIDELVPAVHLPRP